ncbi:hypothetical protein Tco_0562550 [Tanacetum coccineum]
MNTVEVPIIVLIVKQGTRPSMMRVLGTIKILVMTNLHFILISNNSLTVVRSLEDTNRILEELLRTLKPDPHVGESDWSDDYTEVPFDDEQILKQHYTAHVTPSPLAYTPPPPFVTTMEPTDTLLMVDEVISTNPARETDEFIKSSVDDFVPIPKESEVTSDSKLECDMPINTPLPTTAVREENFDINSPLGEYVVDFLMENEDIADLPRHLVKKLFNHLVKNLSSTKTMPDEPLGDDSKTRSYDVTFSNSLFDFNDDYTLCNPDSVSRSLETSDLNLEELTAKIGLDGSIPTETYDGYYDSEGDILFLEHLLIEETFSDPTPTMLHKKSTLLVTPPPASKQSSLKEVEIFDPFSP